MLKDIKMFQPKKQFLLCVDSDGCVIDGMTIKHLECFGPCLVEEWKLQKHQIEVIKFWNEINLFSMTRGINRFKGLLLTLKYVSDSDFGKVDTRELKDWINTTKELSNKSLVREIEIKESEVLNKALRWSERVNECVENLSREKKVPFEGVVDCLKSAAKYADIAVVSSANARAVEEEWGTNHILEYVDVVMTQECGSKADCIQQMLSLGYDNNKILMVGDAPGDMKAAKDNDVLSYPILVEREIESWKRFREVVLDAFLHDTYKSELMDKFEKEFRKNLEGKIEEI